MSPSNPIRSALSPADDLPWWRHTMVWVVIAGPLAVVVAGFATLASAWTHLDPVVSAVVPAQAAPQRGSPSAPAQWARNHAATPQR